MTIPMSFLVQPERSGHYEGVDMDFFVVGTFNGDREDYLDWSNWSEGWYMDIYSHRIEIRSVGYKGQLAVL